MERVLFLKKGMPKATVKRILGTPTAIRTGLSVPAKGSGKWEKWEWNFDYDFGGNNYNFDMPHIVAYFKNGKLMRWGEHGIWDWM